MPTSLGSNTVYTVLCTVYARLRKPTGGSGLRALPATMPSIGHQQRVSGGLCSLQGGPKATGYVGHALREG